jgi:hypothetical protein
VLLETDFDLATREPEALPRAHRGEFLEGFDEEHGRYELPSETGAPADDQPIIGDGVIRLSDVCVTQAMDCFRTFT